MQQIIDENNIEYAIIIPEPEVLYWSEHPFNVNFTDSSNLCEICIE